MLTAQLVRVYARQGGRRARPACVQRDAREELLRVEHRDQGPRRRRPVLGGAGAVLGHGPQWLRCR
jgi:hypothetical protein